MNKKLGTIFKLIIGLFNNFLSNLTTWPGHEGSKDPNIKEFR